MAVSWHAPWACLVVFCYLFGCVSDRGEVALQLSQFPRQSPILSLSPPVTWPDLNHSWTQPQLQEVSWHLPPEPACSKVRPALAHFSANGTVSRPPGFHQPHLRQNRALTLSASEARRSDGGFSWSAAPFHPLTQCSLFDRRGAVGIFLRSVASRPLHVMSHVAGRSACQNVPHSDASTCVAQHVHQQGRSLRHVACTLPVTSILVAVAHPHMRLASCALAHHSTHVVSTNASLVGAGHSFTSPSAEGTPLPGPRASMTAWPDSSIVHAEPAASTPSHVKVSFRLQPWAQPDVNTGSWKLPVNLPQFSHVFYQPLDNFRQIPCGPWKKMSTLLRQALAPAGRLAWELLPKIQQTPRLEPLDSAGEVVSYKMLLTYPCAISITRCPTFVSPSNCTHASRICVAIHIWHMDFRLCHRGDP